MNGLIQKKAIDKLRDMFMKRIEFGTAGLRSRMSAGFANMNDLIIIQTSQVTPIRHDKNVVSIANGCATRM